MQHPFNVGQGWNWNVENWPRLVGLSTNFFSEATFAVVGSVYEIDYFWLDPSNGTFKTRFGRLKTLRMDPFTQIFYLEEADGTVFVFNGFAHLTRPGCFASMTTPGGITTCIHETEGSVVREVRRSYSSGTDTFIESFRYDFFTSGANFGQLERVTLRRQVNGGDWQNVEKAEYSYYGDSSSFGNLNDLQTVTRFVAAGSGWIQRDVQYYRYWKPDELNGTPHGLKFVVQPESWERLSAAVSNPLSADNATIALYADMYYEYDSAKRVTKEITDAGSRTFTFEYTDNPNYSPSSPRNFNAWFRKTSHTLPDGTQQIEYVDDVGYSMLSIVRSGDDEWFEFRRYDDEGREILRAQSSAILGYDEDYSDLLGYNPSSGKYQYLRDDEGLIQRTEFYLTTGGVAAYGYPQRQSIRRGQLGTDVKLKEYEYANPHTDAGGVTVYPVSKEIVYPDADDQNRTIVTTFAYSYYSGTNQVYEQTTTLPAVAAAQNGSGTSTTVVDVLDIFGNRIWHKDERGFITRLIYDIKTKALTQRIDDVETAEVSDEPAGWLTPSEGGLHLVTDFEHDVQGRVTQVLGPVHTVDIAGTATEVRRANWTVYRDDLYEVWEGAGYQKLSNESFTLINPVSIRKMDRNGNVRDEIEAVRESASGKLASTDSFPQSSWVRWTRHVFSDCCKLVATRVYHTIPSSGEGTSGTNYDETQFGYDLRNRRNLVLSPGGTITFTVFDPRGLPSKVFVGTDDSGATEADPTGNNDPNNNMVLVTGNQYDDGAAGGDGLLTTQTQHVSGTDARITEFAYDWRHRLIETDGEVDFCEKRYYDSLDRVVKVERYDTTTGGNRIALSETHYDDLGRVYRTVRYAVDPSDGSVGNSLTEDAWYDASGRVIKLLPAGSKLFTKTVYDSLGRSAATYVGFDVDESSYADVGSITDDTILEQTETLYDDAGNVVQTTHRQRYHDATGTGALGSPSSSQPKARVTYVAAYHDALGRAIAAATYGTNGGSALSRPSTVPARSDTVLVTSTTHDDAGMVQDVTDPAGMVTRTEYDDAGWRVKVIENYQPHSSSSSSSSSGSGCAPSDDVNRETRFAYTPDGALATLTAVNSETGNQVTTYTYGTSLTNSDVAGSTLLREVAYPDSTGDSDTVRYTYNRQGQQVTVTDQRGCVRTFEYDKLGRLIHDRVTTIGSGVDDAVLRISTTYEVRGLVEKLTSYDNAAVDQGNIVNEVQHEYNPFGQVTATYQSHSGAVDTMATPKVEYAYADGSDNHVRPTMLTYPDGREIGYDYGLENDIDDAASRVRDLEDGGLRLVRYEYLGLGTLVQAGYRFLPIELPGGGGYTREMKYTLIGTSSSNDPDTGDQYKGLDRFGRVKDSRWLQYHDGSPNDLDRVKYGYDRASNRIWRENPFATGLSKEFDELYAHDGLHRLKDMARGTLDSGYSTLNSQTFAQCWTLDATGNWKGFRQDDDGNGTWDLAQQRTANAVNEITGVTESAGPSWATPGYDAAGNMTSVPKPADPTAPYTASYNAWNRLVRLEEEESSSSSSSSAGLRTVQVNVYDGRNYRVVRKDYMDGVLAETRQFYYTNQWQSIEERVGAATTPDRQHVWGLRYIDDLVLRERDTDGNGTLDESLYALQDANWNVTAVVSGLYDTEERYAYTAYGEPAVLDEAFVPRSGSNHAWDVLYAGYRWDGGTGLYAVRNRVLHPGLGSWTSRDQSEEPDSASLYEVVAGSPLDLVDPDGLQAQEGGLASPTAACLEELIDSLPASAMQAGVNTANAAQDAFIEQQNLRIRSAMAFPFPMPPAMTNALFFETGVIPVPQYSSPNWAHNMFLPEDPFLQKLGGNLGFFGLSLLGPKAVPRGLTAGRAARAEAEVLRFRSQGYSSRAATRLAQPYTGRGHHFILESSMNTLTSRFGERSLLGRGLTAFRDSRFNVVSGRGMSTGRFYEFHSRLHGGSSFGPRSGQGMRMLPGEPWRAARVSPPLSPFGKAGYLWYGSPPALKAAACAGTAGMSAAAYGAYQWVTGDE